MTVVVAGFRAWKILAGPLSSSGICNVKPRKQRAAIAEDCQGRFLSLPLLHKHMQLVLSQRLFDWFCSLFEPFLNKVVIFVLFSSLSSTKLLYCCIPLVMTELTVVMAAASTMTLESREKRHPPSSSNGFTASSEVWPFILVAFCGAGWQVLLPLHFLLPSHCTAHVLGHGLWLRKDDTFSAQQNSHCLRVDTCHEGTLINIWRSWCGQGQNNNMVTALSVFVCTDWSLQFGWVEWISVCSAPTPAHSSSMETLAASDVSSNILQMSHFCLPFLKCSVMQDVECSSSEVSCQGSLERVSLWFLYGDEFVSGCFVFVNQTILLLNIISWVIVDTACVWQDTARTPPSVCSQRERERAWSQIDRSSGLSRPRTGVFIR